MGQPEFNEQLLAFLEAATTPFHAVAAMVERLLNAGFTQLAEDEDWSPVSGGRYFVVRNGSSIIAFVVGKNLPPSAGLRMVGAHTDSPCLMVKPSPEKVRHGYYQLAVEVYGGALLNPWFDRDLSLAGRVSYENSAGRLRSDLIDFKAPLACIPSLAIHLDRDVNSQRSINSQTDILPLMCRVAEGEKPDFRALLAARLQEEYADCDIRRVLDFELGFYDTQRPSLVGLQQEFIASARLDNLLSCFVGLQALLAADGSATTLLVCNDHEEVGSLSAVGAQGPFLLSVLRRLAGNESALAALVDRSMMISADNAHGIHPNFADRHDDNHGPLLNGGPVIKLNANQRYATNSETSGLFRLLAEQESVPVQSFVARTDMGCGSTIGPITAGATGIRTLDVGVPTFAMHSIRELAGAADAFYLYRVLGRFYNHPDSLGAI